MKITMMNINEGVQLTYSVAGSSDRKATVIVEQSNLSPWSVQEPTHIVIQAKGKKPWIILPLNDGKHLQIRGRDSNRFIGYVEGIFPNPRGES